MTNVLSADTNTNKHYQHNGFSATITNSYASPSSDPRGITWDGTNVISADASADKHYKHNGFSSTITDSYATPSWIPWGITWDGSNVISVDSVEDKHYKHNGFSSTITDSYALPSSFSSTGITWDGTNVLSADFSSNKHYKHNGFSSTITDSYATPAFSATGITWDGTNVLSADMGSNKHYKHNGFSATITNSYASPSSSTTGMWGAGSPFVTYTKTFTADTILKQTSTKTLVSDVLLYTTKAKTFTCDAVLKTTVIKTFTADAIISKKQKTFTADVLLFKTATKTFSANAILVNRHTKEFSTDACLLKTAGKEFTTDAMLLKVATKTFTSDTLLVRAYTKTFTSDATLLKATTKAFTSDANLQATLTKTFTSDALIEATQTKTFTADAIIVNRNTKTFTSDALIEATQTKTFTADAIIVNRNTKAFTSDAFVVAHNVKTFTADALIGDVFPPTQGFYYSKLGTENFINPPDTDFSITEELNGIASFDFVIQNNAANRTIIADHLTEDYKIMRDDGTEILTGSIDSDSITYFAEGEGGAGKRIRLSGYASFIDLAYLIYKRMADADAEAVGSVQDEDNSTSTFTDYTTQANNDTINDVLPTFGAVYDALYVGKDETFFALKVKYSTKGVQVANTTVVIEYSKGSGVWATLDCIDESYAFTEDAGTYLFYMPNKADDWAKDTVNGISQYWIRFRITQGSYTTKPKLDRIWLSNADVCRVQFNDVAADTILGYVLEGTGYSEDATDHCPSTQITIRGEYDTRLRWAFGIGSALTWEDANGDKQRYDVWIDTTKKIHYKQQRGTDKGDLSGDFRAVNNQMGYHGIGTRIFGAGGYDGINQKRAIVEDTAAQATHKLREIVLEDSRITGYEALKAETQKSLTIRKAPLKEVSGDIDTKYWLNNSLAVGDKITINQPDWNLNDQELYIMRAVIAPSNTHLDLGTSQMHLEHMRSSLQRQMDINNVWMHGAVSTYISGPVEDNYQRVDDTTVYPVTMKIQIPSNARAINRVEISWTLSKYKSSVKPSVGGGGGHFHIIPPSGLEGAHLHTIGDSSGDDGHIHTILEEGGHIHTIGGGGGVKTSIATGGAYLGAACRITSSMGVGLHDPGCVSGGYCNNKTVPIGWVCQNFTTESHTHTVNIDHTHSESTEPDHYHSETIDGDHWHTIPNSNTDPDHQHTVPDSDTEPDHEHTTDYGINLEDGGTILELIVNDITVADTYEGDQSNINITGWISSGSNSIKLQPKVGQNYKGRAEISSINTVFLENLK